MARAASHAINIHDRNFLPMSGNVHYVTYFGRINAEAGTTIGGSERHFALCYCSVEMTSSHLGFVINDAET